MPQGEPHFTFRVSTLPEDSFHVVRFSGTEGLSRLYQFDLTLLSDKRSLDFGRALSGTATFSVRRGEGGDLVWRGILMELRLTRIEGAHSYYRAVLVPRAWMLTQTQHSRIFLDQDLTQNLRDCLQDGGLSAGLDFELNTSASYPMREYVCQYNETHMNFVSRWTERNGLYFYFDQSGVMEKMVFTDDLNIHGPHPGGAGVEYSEVSGLDGLLAGRAVKNFQCEVRRVPREVLVRDYNYRTPSLDIEGRAVVSEHGSGTVYAHGGHMRSKRQAGHLARMRAQSLGCRERVYFGESNAPFLQPGYLAKLTGHPREDFNRDYLVIEVKHEGAQESFITSGLGVGDAGDRLYYRNAFAAIESGVQFRAEIKTQKPVVAGVLKGTVDAEGSGEYAQLDDQGRYKVIMPFDLSGRKDGRASSWLRMAQPYAGKDHGMHFPLHKGTEVLIVHYEGDPDRPMIAGAMPNLLSPCVVTSANQTMANITTGGGNRIHMEDNAGSERILLHVSASDNFIRIGAPNDPAGDGGMKTPDAGQTVPQSGPPSGGASPVPPAPPQPAATPSPSPSPTSLAAFKAAGGGINLYTPQALTVKAGFYDTIVLGDNTSTTVGLGMSNNLGELHKFVIGLSTEFKLAGHTEFTPYWKELRTSVAHASNHTKEVVAAHEAMIGRQSLTIASLVSNIDYQEKIMDSYTRTIMNMNATITKANQNIAALGQEVGELTAKVGRQSLTVGNLDDTVAQHTRKIGQMTATYGEYTKTLSTLTRTLDVLTSTSQEETRVAEMMSLTVTNLDIT
jgi:type VI secretion system secreted protein VgrG